MKETDELGERDRRAYTAQPISKYSQAVWQATFVPVLIGLSITQITSPNVLGWIHRLFWFRTIIHHFLPNPLIDYPDAPPPPPKKKGKENCRICENMSIIASTHQLNRDLLVGLHVSTCRRKSTPNRFSDTRREHNPPKKKPKKRKSPHKAGSGGTNRGRSPRTSRSRASARGGTCCPRAAPSTPPLLFAGRRRALSHPTTAGEPQGPRPRRAGASGESRGGLVVGRGGARVWERGGSEGRSVFWIGDFFFLFPFFFFSSLWCGGGALFSASATHPPPPRSD